MQTQDEGIVRSMHLRLLLSWRGERVHAVIVIQPGAAVDLEMIMEFCRGRLAGYKLPRSMEVVDELPRNPTGKILKRQLRSRHWEGHVAQV